MAYKSLKFKIIGVSPLLMHNGQLADPLNSFSKQMKAVSGKRSKTDADYEEMARIEWYGSLYLQDGKPCIPGSVLEAAFIAAARKHKRGKQAQAGIICPNNYEIEYEGDHDLEAMFNHGNRLTVGVKVQQSRVMRTRPIFKEWAATIEVQYDNSLLNEPDVKDIVKLAGEEVGLMDWRPKFGRYVLG